MRIKKALTTIPKKERALIKLMALTVMLILFVACEDTGGKIEGEINSGVLDRTLSAIWRFTSSSDYTFNSSYVEVGGNKASLRTVNTTVDSSATFNAGTYLGTAYSGGVIKLDSTTGADTALSSLWTPKWSSLLGYWKMDNTWTDTTGNVAAGTVSGNSTFSTSAKIGSHTGAFDGTGDYVTFGDIDSIDSATNLSSCVWVKHNTVSGDDEIVSKWNIGANLVGWVLFRDDVAGNSGRTDVYNIVVFNHSDGTSSRIESASNASVTNSWTHVCFTFTAGSAQGLRLYINGIEDANSPASTTGITSINANALPLRVGGTGLDASRDYDGSIDDLAVWTANLSATEIALIYNRQKQKYAGTFDAPIFDIGASATWTSLRSTNVLPFNKELTAASGNESTTNYSSISGSLMTGLVGYWSLNETAAGTAPGPKDFRDRSSTQAHGSASGTVAYNQEGKLSKGVSINGSSGSISIAVAGTDLENVQEADYTFALWFKPTGQSGHIEAGILSKAGWNLGLQYTPTNTFRMTHVRDTPAFVSATSPLSYPLNNWYHVVGTVSKTNGQVKLYVNGKLVQTTNFPAGSNAREFGVGSLVIGGLTAIYPTVGVFDEAAVWSRDLSASEVLELYRRGANRVKYQVRSCIESTCACKSFSSAPAGSASDCDGDGTANASDTSDSHAATFIGPDGSSSTYFSELQNNSSVDASGNPTGSVNTSSLSLDWSATGTHSNITGKPSDNRYFQYRVYLESDDENNLCSAAPCMPEISSITIGPSGRYYGASPTIANTSPINFTQLLSITKSDTANCAKFQISTDGGSSWKWWNGSAWDSASNSVAQSNFISDFNTARLSTLAGGRFNFRAFLNTNSDLTQSCELSLMGITYAR